MRKAWLIIGHGSVGGSLVKRLLAGESKVYVYDPHPRLDLPGSGQVVPVTEGPIEGLDYVAICVPAAASTEAATFVRDTVEGSIPVFDWTSALPATKKDAALIAGRPWLDVALLDSVDRVNHNPLVALSGHDAATHSRALRELSFDVVVVGQEVGGAARVKLVRSLFMKGLEALVMEARAIARRLEPTGTAWQSIERNLGPTFAKFADLLVVSDATHATRRSMEIGEAVEFARGQGLEPLIATAACEVLSRLGTLWDTAPPAVTEEVFPELLLQHALSVFSDGSAAVAMNTTPSA